MEKIALSQPPHLIRSRVFEKITKDKKSSRFHVLQTTARQQIGMVKYPCSRGVHNHLQWEYIRFDLSAA